MTLRNLLCIYILYMSSSKTKILLAYIVRGHEHASVTEIMKLSYLIDLVSSKKRGKKISDFTYRRYNFGPFDERIYSFLSILCSEEVLINDVDYTSLGSEYVVYTFNKEKECSFDELAEEEKKLADEVLEKVKGYGAKTLTEIAYKTKPMQKLGATIGGKENINVELDLNCD